MVINSFDDRGGVNPAFIPALLQGLDLARALIFSPDLDDDSIGDFAGAVLMALRQKPDNPNILQFYAPLSGLWVDAFDYALISMAGASFVPDENLPYIRALAATVDTATELSDLFPGEAALQATLTSEELEAGACLWATTILRAQGEVFKKLGQEDVNILSSVTFGLLAAGAVLAIPLSGLVVVGASALKLYSVLTVVSGLSAVAVESVSMSLADNLEIYSDDEAIVRVASLLKEYVLSGAKTIGRYRGALDGYVTADDDMELVSMFQQVADASSDSYAGAMALWAAILRGLSLGTIPLVSECGDEAEWEQEFNFLLGPETWSARDNRARSVTDFGWGRSLTVAPSRISIQSPVITTRITSVYVQFSAPYTPETDGTFSIGIESGSGTIALQMFAPGETWDSFVVPVSIQMTAQRFFVTGNRQAEFTGALPEGLFIERIILAGTGANPFVV